MLTYRRYNVMLAIYVHGTYLYLVDIAYVVHMTDMVFLYGQASSRDHSYLVNYLVNGRYLNQTERKHFDLGTD